MSEKDDQAEPEGDRERGGEVPGAGVAGVGGDEDRADHGADGRGGGEPAEAAGADVEDLLGDGGQEGLVGEGDHDDDKGGEDEVEDGRAAGDVGEAIAQVGQRRTRYAASTSRRQLEHCDAGDDEADRGHVVHAGKTDEVDADKGAGEAGADDPRAVHAHLLEDDGVAEVFAADEVADEGLPGGADEGKASALDDTGDDQHPEGDVARGNHGRKPGGVGSDDQLGDDEGLLGDRSAMTPPQRPRTNWGMPKPSMTRPRALFFPVES